MTREKIKSEEKVSRLRRGMAQLGIFRLTELARHLGCSRQSIYFALERPSRYPIVHAKLEEIIDATE